MRERNCTIKLIIGQPTYFLQKYWVSVQYECEGDLAYTRCCFDTFDEACELKIGDYA